MKPTLLKNHGQEQLLFRRRVIVMLGFVLFLAASLLLRMGYLQIIDHSRYQHLSLQNKLTIIPTPPSRGLIVDRNGVLLAKNIPVHQLDIIPDQVTNLDNTLNALIKLLAIRPDEIELFQKIRRQYRKGQAVTLRTKLSHDEVAKFAVNQHRFPGVKVNAGLVREYPFNEDFAHVLGFVGRINVRELGKLDKKNYRATNYIGKVGIEKFYEQALHGQSGYRAAEVDASGKIVRTLKTIPAQAGTTLQLTIDSQLQQAAVKALGKHRGAVIAVIPDTGEVLALVSNPSYDPNQFVRGISHKDYGALANSPDMPLYNRAIRGQYPPASTIKPFLILEALDKNIISTTDHIHDPGWFKLPNNNHIYRDWNRQGHGWINGLRAITVSCDTFFYELANKMGMEKMARVLKQFGLGQSTTVDMGEEVPGIMPSPQWKKQAIGEPWYTGDTILSGIGQGFMLSTPIQLAQATAILANRGKLAPLHLQKRPPFPAKTVVQLKNPEIWAEVIQAMQRVITHREGTGRRFGRKPPYKVAAKTGTAQVYSAKVHGYKKMADLPEHLRDHSLFIAFAPVNQPKIAIAAVVENSPMAPKVTRKVMDAYLVTKTLEKEKA